MIITDIKKIFEYLSEKSKTVHMVFSTERCDEVRKANMYTGKRINKYINKITNQDIQTSNLDEENDCREDLELKGNVCEIDFECNSVDDYGNLDCAYFRQSRKVDGCVFCESYDGQCTSAIARVNAMVRELKKLGVTAHLTGRPMWKCMNDVCGGECVVECEEQPFGCLLGGGSQEFKRVEE